MLKNYCNHCAKELNVLKVIRCIRAVLQKEPDVSDEKLSEIDCFCDDNCFNDYLAKRQKQLVKDLEG